MYWLASRTVAKDMADTHAALLAARESAEKVTVPRS
jgi:hypothetical protein